MTTNHRIDLQPHDKGYDGAKLFYQGKQFGFETSGAIYAAARWLLAQGIAQRGDMVTIYRGETAIMTGEVTEMAKWTVWQNKRGNPSLQLVRWKPFKGMGKAPESPTADEEEGGACQTELAVLELTALTAALDER